MSAAHKPGDQREPSKYRITVYANDVTGRQVDEFIVTDLAHVGRWVALSFDLAEGAGEDVRVIVAKVAA